MGNIRVSLQRIVVDLDAVAGGMIEPVNTQCLWPQSVLIQPFPVHVHDHVVHGIVQLGLSSKIACFLKCLLYSGSWSTSKSCET